MRTASLRKCDGRAEVLRRAGRDGVARAAGGVEVAEPLPETLQLGLDLLRRLAVALRAAREIAEPDRLAVGDRDRLEVAGTPLVRAVDRRAHDGRVLLER